MRVGVSKDIGPVQAKYECVGRRRRLRIGEIGNDLLLTGTAGATTVTLTGASTTSIVTISSVPKPGTITLELPAAVVTDTVGNDSLDSILTANAITAAMSPGLSSSPA